MSIGAGMGIVPPLLIQEALVTGLQALASERRAREELVARSDALQHGTATAWERTLRDALTEMLNPQSDQAVEVVLGYPAPQGQARFPLLTIVVQGGGDNAGEAVVGRVLRAKTEFHGPNSEAWQTLDIGDSQTTTLQIGAWSPAPERSALLIAAARWAIIQQDESLRCRGVHDFSMQEGGVEVSPELEPRIAYVPMISLSIHWTWRRSQRGKVPNRVTMLPASFST